jgi:hypothetical protein
MATRSLSPHQITQRLLKPARSLFNGLTCRLLGQCRHRYAMALSCHALWLGQSRRCTRLGGPFHLHNDFIRSDAASKI